jgi:hypothetical protein
MTAQLEYTSLYPPDRRTSGPTRRPYVGLEYWEPQPILRLQLNGIARRTGTVERRSATAPDRFVSGTVVAYDEPSLDEHGHREMFTRSTRWITAGPRVPLKAHHDLTIGEVEVVEGRSGLLCRGFVLAPLLRHAAGRGWFSPGLRLLASHHERGVRVHDACYVEEVSLTSDPLLARTRAFID